MRTVTGSPGVRADKGVEPLLGAPVVSGERAEKGLDGTRAAWPDVRVPQAAEGGGTEAAGAGQRSAAARYGSALTSVTPMTAPRGAVNVRRSPC